MWAIDDNKAMFVYRQVRPVDAVIVRAALDGFLNLLIGLIALAVLALLGRNVILDNPLLVMAAVLGIWLLGLGFGLMPLYRDWESSLVARSIFPKSIGRLSMRAARWGEQG